MSLALAHALDGPPLPPLKGQAPYPCCQLLPWKGRTFWMPPGDERLIGAFHGDPPPSPAFRNLQGHHRMWEKNADWMDFLDPGSPAHGYKMLERDLYLHYWESHLSHARRVLDLGGGIGRFARWLLDHEREVELVDPDLRSLWRALDWAAGAPGRLDLHWSTGERLPELEPVDVVVAAEVLNYVEDPVLILDGAARVLKPGGVLLASVEARYGWAASPDVEPGSLGALFTDGIVDLPGDRWVRTYQESEFRALLEARFQVQVMEPTHYVTSGPFEAAACPSTVTEVLLWEDRCRSNPVVRPWNRAWTAVARRV